MKLLTPTVAALTMLAGLGFPQTSHAIRMDIETQAIYTCSVASITIEGVTTYTKSCWVDYYYVESGLHEFEFDGAFDWMEYGGGGSWQNAGAMPVIPGLKASLNGKKGWSTEVSCSDEPEFRAQAAQLAAEAFAPTGGRPKDHVITLYMPNGEVQTFMKISKYASEQYQATSNCTKQS